MMRYYLAQQGCAMVGVHRRVLLRVEGNEIGFRRGSVEDKFKVGPDGKVFCTTDERGFPYEIYGPLNEEELSKIIKSEMGYFTGERRSNSSRKE